MKSLPQSVDFKFYIVFKDHPLHFFPMLGGAWSFANKRNRELGNEIFSKLTNPSIIRAYNNRLYLEDQYFLVHHVWPIAKLNSTIHDSYFCEEFGGKPFPNRRENMDCFVSCSNCCLTRQQNMSRTLISEKSVGKYCPSACRKNNEWTFC